MFGIRKLKNDIVELKNSRYDSLIKQIKLELEIFSLKDKLVNLTNSKLKRATKKRVK